MTQASAISVSAALSLAKKQLESITVKVLGEVSELSNKRGYKAVYFTIKDKDAALPCMMWMNRYDAANVPLEVGMLVEVTGRFSLYAAKGRMNFDVFSLALAGEGNLRLQVAALAKKLEAEGLMAPSMRKPLPAYPLRIGLVTSPRGAAVYDVLRTLKRRYPLATVLLAGVAVEGPQAPRFLSEGLDAVAQAGAEVILLVRGGGSFEDLMPFNDEGLARKIASMPVPVITGIGHEPDTSIADMVADMRASTPTAAAETVAVSLQETAGALERLAQRLHIAEMHRVSRMAMATERIASLSLFKEPMRLMEREAQALDDMAQRLSTALPDDIARQRIRIEKMQIALAKGMPSLLIGYAAALRHGDERLQALGHRLTVPFRERAALASVQLESLSPLSVLARGYAIARDGSDRIVRSVDAVAQSDPLSVQCSDGYIDCVVSRVRPAQPWTQEMEVQGGRASQTS